VKEGGDQQKKVEGMVGGEGTGMERAVGGKTRIRIGGKKSGAGGGGGERKFGGEKAQGRITAPIVKRKRKRGMQDVKERVLINRR